MALGTACAAAGGMPASRWWVAIVVSVWSLGCAKGGGDGDAPGSSSGAGASTSGPCAVDCTAIEAPACQQATCNTQTGDCEVGPSREGSACDDGLFCTVDDVCSAGTCGGEPNTCGLSEHCATVACDEASDACSVQTQQPDGTPCPAADLCTVDSTCQAGQCLGTAKDCFFTTVPDCHVAQCNPSNGECEPVPGNDGLACEDPSDICTDKTCSAGACSVAVGPKDCSALDDGCNLGSCDLMQGCVPQPLAQGTLCPESTDACNSGACDGAGTCIAGPVNDGMACDDGIGCTSGSICAQGNCGGGSSSGLVVYFHEDFSDNGAGWTLGPEWQIGAAEISSGAMWALEDPDSDSTPSYDDGVAGLIIGGHPSTTPHAMHYLESAPFDASGSGPVYLEYKRWLNTTLAVFVYDRVEVFDGTSWVMIWDSNDITNFFASSWTTVSHDVTQHKNAAMRVRFGFEVFAQNTPAIASWNIDDLLVSNQPCL